MPQQWGVRSQITRIRMAFGTCNPIISVLGPLGFTYCLNEPMMLSVELEMLSAES